MRFSAARAAPQIDNLRRRCPGSRIQQGFQGFAIAPGDKIIERRSWCGNEIEDELLHTPDYTNPASLKLVPTREPVALFRDEKNGRFLHRPFFLLAEALLRTRIGTSPATPIATRHALGGWCNRRHCRRHICNGPANPHRASLQRYVAVHHYW